jgi:hypothetical protein
MIACGAINSGSSSTPDRIRIGMPAGSIVALKSCEPHFGQKPLRTKLPLSATISIDVKSPSNFTLSAGNKTFTVAEPLATRWQSLHQHIRAPMGSASMLKRICPHKQWPETAMV